MSFALYLIGFVVLIAGLAFGANMLHVAPRWIAVGAIVLVGLGIVTGVRGPASAIRSNGEEIEKMRSYRFDGDSRMPGQLCRSAWNPALGYGLRQHCP